MATINQTDGKEEDVKEEGEEGGDGEGEGGGFGEGGETMRGTHGNKSLDYSQRGQIVMNQV